jgi:hypothetical protein
MHFMWYTLRIQGRRRGTNLFQYRAEAINSGSLLCDLGGITGLIPRSFKSARMASVSQDLVGKTSVRLPLSPIDQRVVARAVRRFAGREPALGHRLGESGGCALTAGTPSPKAPIERVPVAARLRHVAPGRAGAQPPQDAGRCGLSTRPGAVCSFVEQPARARAARRGAA